MQPTGLVYFSERRGQTSATLLKDDKYCKTFTGSQAALVELVSSVELTTHTLMKLPCCVFVSVIVAGIGFVAVRRYKR